MRGRISADIGRYSQWTSGAQVFSAQEVPPAIKDEYETLMTLVVPSRFLAILAQVSDPDYRPFAKTLLVELSTSGTGLTEEADHNRIIARWSSIADAHCQIAALNEHTNEATLKKGVDPILVVATSRSNINAKILSVNRSIMFSPLIFIDTNKMCG